MSMVKKIVSLILSALVVFSSLAFCVSAAADITEKTGFDKGLIINITPDKDSYKSGDTASVTVKVINIYGFDINNIIISLDSTDCKLPRGEKSQSQIKTKLGNNESFSESFKIKLGSNAKLGFFQKILFFIRNLFNPMDDISPEIDKNKIALKGRDSIIYLNRAETQIKFASADCKLNVFVRYDFDINKDSCMLDNIIKNKSVVDYTGDKSEAKAKEIVEELDFLNLIDNVEHDDDEQIIWYEYKQTDGSDAIGGIDYSSVKEDYNEYDLLTDDQPDEQIDGVNPAFLIFDGFSSGSYFNNEDNEYVNLKDEYGKYYPEPGSGHISACYENFLKLSGSIFMCISCHGGVYYNGTPFIRLTNCPDDKPEFKDELRTKNAAVITRIVEDIDNKTSDFIAKKYGILFPKFFSNKSFDNTVIFLESCCGFGKDSVKNDFAEQLCNAGCKAVIGFQNNVNSKYSFNFMNTFVKCFAEGMNIKDSFDQSKKTNAEKDTGGAASILYTKDNGTTILDCGPNVGKLAGIQLNLTDFDGNSTGSTYPLILIGAGTTITNDIVLNFVKRYKIGDWNSYSIDFLKNDSSINSEAVNGEIYKVIVEVD